MTEPIDPCLKNPGICLKAEKQAPVGHQPTRRRPIMASILCLAMLSIIGWQPASLSAADSDCIPVTTAQVEKMNLERTVRAIGTLEAIQQVTIRPEITGVIEAVHFQEGTPVEKGELLFTIDDAKIREQLNAKKAALEEARANLENAQLIYNRRQRLFKQKLGTEEARDEARSRYKAIAAQVERLKAEIQGVKETLADTRVKAPFAGIIGEQHVDTGEWVDIGMQLAPLVQTNRLKIAFTVPEKYSGQTETGQTIKVRTPATPEEERSGTVYFVSPVIRQKTRSLLLKAHIDNPRHVLFPGGFASVDLILELLENRPIIPEEALVPTRSGYMVFVVEDSVAKGREIEIGLRKTGIVEIKKGLSQGETIIQSGHIAVSEGDKVCPQQ